MRNDSGSRRRHWPLVGGFRYWATEDRWEWSDEVARIYGYEPDGMVPTTDLLLAHQHPADKTTVAELIEQVRRHEAAFSCRHRIIDTQGRTRTVVVVGDRCYADDGAIAGFFVDITEQFRSDAQQLVTEAVEAISARRAVINQATGILMLRFGITAESAFGLLTRVSQDSNTKLRVVAEHLVSQTGRIGTFPEDGPASVDTVLRTFLGGAASPPAPTKSLP